jgi:hypothetical protein
MQEVKCPNCKNIIYDEDALLCHFCGESLERAGQGFISRIKYNNVKAWWFFLVFFVLLAFIFLVAK